MAKSSLQPGSRGPFRADHLRSGDPYELSNGHPVHCLPTGGRGGRAANLGGGVLASDPAAQDVGVDVGFSPSPEILRAPDVSVGEIPDQPGWVQGAPPLAVEYADTGQDEADLRIKIGELFNAGTRYVWVVRLTGPRRVEVHQPDQGVRIANPGEQLTAPGILANPVPVEALYDREAARHTIFRNLLQREGYSSLEDVRAEGGVQSLRDAILEVLTARGLEVSDELRTALGRAHDQEMLRSVLRQAAVATTADEIVAALPD
jgi:Uma2 family endonuclease